MIAESKPEEKEDGKTGNESVEIIVALHLKQKKEQIVVKGKLEAAFTYLLNQGKYLRVFLEGGDVPMDNNASERCDPWLLHWKKKKELTGH